MWEIKFHNDIFVKTDTMEDTIATILSVPLPLLVPAWTPQKLREIWKKKGIYVLIWFRAGEKVNVWKYLIFSSVGSLSSFPCFTIPKENILRPFLWYFFSLRQGNSDRQGGFQLIEKYAAISAASSVTSKLQNPIKRSSSDLSTCLEHVWKQKSFFVREETKKCFWGIVRQISAQN